MNAKDAIRITFDMSEQVIQAYLSDLDDSDLLVRAVPGMNHIAWQVGHLISTERYCAELLRPGTSPPLPEGFEEAHGKDGARSDDRARFLTRDGYLALWKAQREATRAAIDAVPESDLDRTDPAFPPYASTVGALLNMAGVHTLMHVGQFVAVRRLLNKPVTI
jgi:hypothetical protein